MHRDLLTKGEMYSKNFYHPLERVNRRTPDEANLYKGNQKITVYVETILNPVLKLEELGIPTQLMIIYELHNMKPHT